VSMRIRTKHATRWIVWAALACIILTLASCQPTTVSGSTPIFIGDTSAAPPAPSVTLALLGDVMLGREVHPSDESFAYLKPFLASADVAVANLESPLTESPTQTESSYVLCAPPENAQYLVDAGFDLLALSNNHSLDCGVEGLNETQITLAEAGLGFIGPDSGTVYRSINEISLAFLAFDATAARFDVETAIQAVRSAHQAGALVVVSIHWGAEYQAGASTSQKDLAEQLAVAGATLIWGHHPHVLQPSEWIADHKTLVLYSLGNALFDQYGLDSTRQSALVLVSLNAYGVVQLKIVPFLIDYRHSRVIEAGPTDAQRIVEYFK
jgi:poly-gamma-glutamate synthesis protein (capsule biosynthesis protein)